MEPDQKANLGCGTLILIALIVLLFGNTGKEQQRLDMQQLQQTVERQELLINKQSQQLDAIQKLLERKSSTEPDPVAAEQ